MELLGTPVVLWLACAVLAAVIEAVSCCLISVWFVGGAIVAAIAAAVGAPVFVQVILFLIVSGVCAALLRPLVLARRADKASDEPTMVGQRLRVSVSGNGVAGVRAVDDHGMDWAVVPADGRALKGGELVEVVEQRSATLVVKQVRE